MKLRSPLSSDRHCTLCAVGMVQRQFALVLLMGLGGLLLLWVALRNSSQKESKASSDGGGGIDPAEAGVSVQNRRRAPVRRAETATARQRFSQNSGAAPTDPTEEARLLIAWLKGINPDLVTPETIAENQEMLLTLQSLNGAAIPALEEFFFRGDNLRFEFGPSTNLLGAPTLRIALLKLLSDFTAPENEELEVRLLQLVSDPEEVALLANQLEAAAPGKYREIIRDAAEASLRLADEGRFPGQDTTPVVRILERLSDDDEPSP